MIEHKHKYVYGHKLKPWAQYKKGKRGVTFMVTDDQYRALEKVRDTINRDMEQDPTMMPITIAGIAYMAMEQWLLGMDIPFTTNVTGE